jgi:hypothetical protein
MLEITTLFLAVVFIAAEFYRFNRRITGSVRKISSLDGDPTGLMGANIQVATSEAGEITAFVSSCQWCASPIKIGETIMLIPGANGYVVKSPWIARRRHSAQCRAGISPEAPGVDAALGARGLWAEPSRRHNCRHTIAGETPALPGIERINRGAYAKEEAS